MTRDIGTLTITEKHIDKVVEALKSNRLSYGPMTDSFEKRFSKLHGNKYGIFVNSGTSALQAALHAMKIYYGWKDGDEVILPATTFVASYNVILQNKLKPVLVDIGTDLNINPILIKDKITSRTRAIMPVHLLGRPCDMDKILSIAKKHNLKVIEDSCETMGVKGTGLGDVACYSFYIAHLLVTGVGGMAITNNKELAELIRSLIFHGRDTKYLSIDDDDKFDEEVIHSRFKFNYPGYSYRGTEMESALGLVELDLLKDSIKIRQRNAKRLNDQINYWKWQEDYFDNNASMMYPLILPYRTELMLHLEKNGIETRTVMPLINQPYIKVEMKDFPMSKMVLERGLLIGCHQKLTDEDIDYMADTINKFYERI